MNYFKLLRCALIITIFLIGSTAICGTYYRCHECINGSVSQSVDTSVVGKCTEDKIGHIAYPKTTDAVCAPYVDTEDCILTPDGQRISLWVYECQRDTSTSPTSYEYIKTENQVPSSIDSCTNPLEEN